ncbi:MAG: hypothetical protein OXU79_14125 [Gemmatimonadota bacterium]|nr:hypothetical protein [Gemmatimonadota bacterium]
MLLRIFLFCLLLVLVFRVFRDLLRASVRWISPRKSGARPNGKKPSWQADKDRVTDAEFRDVDD